MVSDLRVDLLHKNLWGMGANRVLNIWVLNTDAKSYQLCGEAIRTHLLARKSEGVFCKQMFALKYGGFRKAYSIYLLLSVPCGLCVSVRPFYVFRRRRPCPSIVRFQGRGGGINTLL